MNCITELYLTIRGNSAFYLDLFKKMLSEHCVYPSITAKYIAKDLFFFSYRTVAYGL